MSTYYEAQERAFAPGIADGWPQTIPAPHTPNGRLVRVSDANANLYAAAPAMLAALERYMAGHPCEGGDTCPTVFEARAAIAQARGGEKVQG